MLRMTKQADYGVVLLSRMASEPSRVFSTTELADGSRIPAPTVSKILKLLVRGELLRSRRGAKGGYCLSRTPQRISVADIIAALEGPIAITECVDESPAECSQEARCPVRGNWQRINLAIREALESISLADMCRMQASDLVTLGSRPSRGNSVRKVEAQAKREQEKLHVT
jgi:FeS assembly SUF system regulator